MKQRISKIGILALSAALSALNAQAFSPSQYSTSSVLSTGKWVRVAVDRDGMFQITADELRQMGFSDINRVKVYGQGGHMIGEILDGSATDDLIEQPTLLHGNKLCFYGRGPLSVKLNSSSTPTRFERRVNSYSTTGSYFLTEGDAPQRVIQRTWIEGTGQRNHTESYDWVLHEREMLTLSRCGKDLLGENLRDGSVTIPYELPHLSSTTLTVTARAALNCEVETRLTASVKAGGTTLNIPFSENVFKQPGTLTYYTLVTPTASVTLPSLSTNSGEVCINQVTATKTITSAHLDYVLLTYRHSHSLAGMAGNQMRIMLDVATLGDTITVNGGSNLVVWNVDGNVPIQMAAKTEGGKALFNVARSAYNTEHYVFDPSQELFHISSYESVANQNLHASPTPDMIIVTHPDFMSQANQLAELHRTHDHADVLVVNEQEVFNEFSSGTRDAMGLRLMCKMFYDRDPQKLKYLLLLGQGTYDNRQLTTVKPGCIITFESDRSDYETKGYAADDFFGILDDGSGENLNSDKVRLGVGRLTPAQQQEAQVDVDKIVKYVTQPDYGSWRNNAFISGGEGKDEREGDMHIHQAQGICELIADKCGLKMAQWKDFIPMFPKATDEAFMANDENKSCPEASKFMADALLEGQYYATYVGHAGSSGFAGSSRLWTINNVVNTPYEHLPIMTTACCNVARFDSNARGVAEYMFHKPDGGCIAMLVATREALASGNDMLNRAFTEAMFTLNSDGSMPTLGQTTMRAKNSLNNNDTKMNFMLLGDPMIKVNFPRPIIEVTRVNGTDVSNNALTTVSPMQQVTIEAEVLKQDKSGIDDTFTGEATVSVYDVSRLFRYATAQLSSSVIWVTRRIDYPRTLITKIDAQAVNGKIKTTLMLPRYIEATDTTLLVSVYAHKAGSDEMASGSYDNLYVGEFNAAEAVTDNQAPVIEAMYLGDDAERFAQNPNIGAKSVLHIIATDETALSGVTGELSNTMRLTLDHGNKSFSLAKHSTTMSDQGKRIDMAFPMNDLTAGPHNLTFTIYDMAGNTATQSIEFTVDQTSSLTLAAEESTVSSQTRFAITQASMGTAPHVTIKVTDAVGNLVWQKTTATFPCTWDLKGLNGQRVDPGLYRYWCTYDTDEYYGGSPIGELIVLEP